jgi:cytochrome c1
MAEPAARVNLTDTRWMRSANAAWSPVRAAVTRPAVQAMAAPADCARRWCQRHRRDLLAAAR